LETIFHLVIKCEDIVNLVDSKDFTFSTNLNYKKKVSNLTYGLIGSFAMNNVWSSYNNQHDVNYSLGLTGNLLYEIDESFDITNSLAFAYDQNSYRSNSYYIVLEEDISYEISPSLETSFRYEIRKRFYEEESIILQSLDFIINTEISDRYNFEVAISFNDVESIYISANLQLNI